MLIFYKAKPQRTKAIASFYFIKNRAVTLPHTIKNFFLHLKSSLEKETIKGYND